MKRLLLTVLIVFAFSQIAMARGKTPLSRGTKQLGGRVTLDIEVEKPEEGDSESGGTINISPSGGYFIINNLELLAEIGFTKSFGDLNDSNWGKAIRFSFDLGVKYYIPAGPFALYAGALLGMWFVKPDEGDSLKAFTVTMPLGLLIPLNRHVAIDVGTQIAIHAGLDDQGTSLSIPIGYLGVQAFF